VTNDLCVGVSGARRDACVAVWGSGNIRGVCPQERVTRFPRVGVLTSGFPQAAFAAIAPETLTHSADQWRCATAEEAILPFLPRESELADHHEAHAALALAHVPEGTNALACVCDRHEKAEVSFWERRGTRLRPLQSWSGPGFATALVRAATALGFTAERISRFEALARIAPPSTRIDLTRLIHLDGDGVVIDDRLEREIADAAGPLDTFGKASVASAVQGHLKDLLLQSLASVRSSNVDAVALGGGLFHNTAFCTSVATSKLFHTVAVPVDPGNGGLAAGTLLRVFGANGLIEPFLGPAIDDQTTKAVLDNCKLSYDYVPGDALLDATVKALRQGLLVGRADGPMEWGRRALGNRSIFADPFAPFVLENLNRFLKQREPYVSYGLATCEEDIDRYFLEAQSSPLMQFEFELREPAAFGEFLPTHATRVRVQTVPPGDGWLRRLLEAFGASGRPRLLVNTSFNGWREPIVCTARDAVRVFYSTGMDVLLVGNFILRK